MLYQFNLILNYNQGLALLGKNRSLGLIVTNIYKNRTVKIYLFNYSMLDYSWSYDCKKNSWPTHINSYLKLKLLKRKIVLYPYKDTRKVKDFQKLSNKDIYVTLQSNSTK